MSVRSLWVRASGTSTATRPGNSMAVGTSSAVLLAASPNRRFLHISGGTGVTIAFGAAAAAGAGILVNGVWTMPSDAPFTGAVYAIATTASNVAVVEW